MEITEKKLAELIPYERNAKQHDQTQIANVAKSIDKYGFVQPIVIDKNNVIVIGHCRALAAKKLGLETVPTVSVENLSEDEVNALRIVDNKTNESPWDFSLLEEELGKLDLSDYDLDFPDLQEDSDPYATQGEHGKLTDKYIIPPFSVLDARQGYWKDRKTAWRDKIQDKSQTREGANPITWLTDAFSASSLLDPVLAELACRWFAPPNCNTFDCFAGDTEFGYVSGYLGNNFTGVELREEQCQFNRAACDGLPVKYICDDGRNILAHIGAGTQDLLFSCPPYFDLEVYSNKENDASNQKTYQDFYAIIDSAFTAAIRCLKDNRFAVIVCSDIRNTKTGEYYRFPDDIKDTFKRGGMCLYNELVLVDAIGTARLRANQNMKTRKVVRVHQNVLVFYKGDTKRIKDHFPALAFNDEEMLGLYGGADI